MRSRLLINFLLILVLACLGAYLLWDREPSSASPDRLVMLDRDQIARVSILKNKDFEIDMTRNSQTWLITKPFRARANSEVVKLILDLTDAFIINEIKNSPENLGFNPPQYTVSLDQETIKFGSINEVTNEQYIQVGSHTFLTKTHHGYNLPHDPIKVVDRRILGVEEIPILLKANSWRAERQENQSWAVMAADNNLMTIASSKIQIWVAGWRSTAATKIELTNEAPGPIYESVSITFENGNQVVVSIEKDSDGYLLRRSDETVAYRIGHDAGLRLIDPYEVARTL
ncbi:MAG TPA: hypothetical protein DEO41_07805 [Betaproteobacteria bacterium]|jgi:hypothetical protein|nr:hypothetical protein [Betaproteobacteria bacterium]